MADSLQDTFSKEWDAIKGAPFLYLAAIVVVVITLYGVSQWAYGRVLDQKDAQIATLKARVEAVTAELSDLKGKAQSASSQPSIARDPDRIYQFGDEVARVSGVEIDRSQSLVRFTSIVGGSNLDINQLMQFRRFYLGLCSFGIKGTQAQVGMLTATTYGQVSCKILYAEPS